MKLSSLRTNEEAENKGVWIKYDDAEFLLCAMNNPAHQRAMMRHGRTHAPAKLRNDPAVQEKVAIDAMADAILKGWKNVTEEDGETQIPYTRENAVKLLQIRPLREFIATQCDNIANFQTEGDAADCADLKSGS